MSQPIIFYKSTYCAHSWTVEQFLEANNVPIKKININHDPQARQEVMALNNGYASVPTLVFPDGTQLTEPSIAQLKEKLGINSPSLITTLKGFFRRK